MTATKVPGGLGSGGARLWRDITKLHDDLDAGQLVTLEEACRAKDRCDRLAAALNGDDFFHVEEDERGGGYNLRVDGVVGKANETSNVLKQLLVALRLPDGVTGKRPQLRGARGAQKPSIPGGKPKPVSSLERARMRREASSG